MSAAVDNRREAIAAICREYPDAQVPSGAESWVSNEPNRQVVYINATRREGLAAGTTYRTWAVVFVKGNAVEVSHVDSLACTVIEEVN